jgi:putative membrane protein
MRIQQTISGTLLAFGLTVAVGMAQQPADPQTRSGSTSSQTGTSATQSRDRTQSSTSTSSSTKDTQSTAGAEAMVGRQDQEFMTKAAQSGMMEVQLAKIAQEKATSDEVKQYAKTLEQDHSKANEQLKKLAEQKGVDLPSDLGKHQEMITKMSGLSGEKFDREYMKMQTKHHKKDISEFKKHTNRSMDSDVKAFAEAQLPTLEQHLQQAQQVSGTGTRARQADTQRPQDSDATKDRSVPTTDPTRDRVDPNQPGSVRPQDQGRRPGSDPVSPTPRP